MRCLIIIIALFLLATGELIAQDDKFDRLIEAILDNIDEDEAGVADADNLAENLMELLASPINLNSASVDELGKLWFLSDYQVYSLLEYRKSVGTIRSIYELEFIYGFNKQSSELLRNFVYLGEKTIRGKDSPKFRLQSNKTRQGMLYRTILKPSDSDESIKIPSQLIKYNIQSGKSMMAGISLENDVGEAFTQSGFDYYSGYLQYSGEGIVNKMVVGNYRACYGQGLLIWNGLGTYKGELATLRKRSRGLAGTNSSMETGLMRGAAFELRKDKIRTSIYASYNSIDTRFDSIGNAFGVTSWNKTGLHRTETEKEGKGASNMKTVGANVQYAGLHLMAGANYVYTQFSHPFVSTDKAYQFFRFEGQEIHGISADYSYLKQNIQLYGEVAFSKNSFAQIHGVNFIPSQKFQTGLVYRNYPRAYYSPYSNAFGENSGNSNEQGVFMGMKYGVGKVTLDAYSDVFSFPWLKHLVDAPSAGYENMVRISYKPNGELNLELKYKYEEKGKNYTTERKNSNLQQTFRQAVRLHVNYSLYANLSLATRMELSKAGQESPDTYTGLMFYQQMRYHPSDRLQLYLRSTWYDIQDYSARIYAYENSVLYYFSIPAYNGKGQSTFVMAKFTAFDGLDIWLRYGFSSQMENRDERTKWQAIAQVRYRF